MDKEINSAETEKFHQLTRSIVNEWKAVALSIVSTYSNALDATLHCEFADEDDLKAVQYTRKTCALFIQDIEHRL